MICLTDTICLLMHLCVELVLFCVFAGMMSSTLCISRQLNDFERSYSDTELEALELSGIPPIGCLCTQFVVYILITKPLLICFLQQF